MEAYRSGHNGPDSKSGSPHGLVGSNPTASANSLLPKRFYAHKRRYKAICGHKSCEKQDSRSTDIFDTKVDLNPPLQNFFDWNWIFLPNRLWIISRSREIIHGRFFVFRILTKKILTWFEPFWQQNFRNQNCADCTYYKYCKHGACKLHLINMRCDLWAPFLFSDVIRKYNRSPSRKGLEI